MAAISSLTPQMGHGASSVVSSRDSDQLTILCQLLHLGVARVRNNLYLMFGGGGRRGLGLARRLRSRALQGARGRSRGRWVAALPRLGKVEQLRPGPVRREEPLN
jgi:hypothetical protein